MFQEFLQRTFYQNTVLDYLICLSIFIAGIIIISVFKKVLLKHLKRLAEKTVTTIDDFLINNIEKNLVVLLYFGVLYIGIQTLILNPILTRGVNILWSILLTIFGVRFLLAIINYGLETYWGKKDKARKQAVKSMFTIIKFVIWSLAIVLLLDNLGIKITALVAGLGIGGVAVALAAQSILKDLFSYFSIFFDHPFEVGDFIIVGEFLGTIEYIGIKTTRIRSLSGEELVFSNTDLTNSRIRNYKRMKNRRVLFKIGVTYQTSSKNLKEIPTIIKNIISSVDGTIFDRAHFSSYGDFSLIYEIVYYVVGRDYNKYMDIQQEINLNLKEEFEKRGIEFAYPTQMVYLNKE